MGCIQNNAMKKINKILYMEFNTCNPMLEFNACNRQLKWWMEYNEWYSQYTVHEYCAQSTIYRIKYLEYYT